MIKTLRQYNLLIAEDNANTLKEIVQYFGYYFARVLQAKDGKQALEIFKQEKPEIVILDISMPYMNGIELTHAINKIDPSTQIIILSAHNEEDILIKAIEADLVTYVIKPLSRQKAKDLLLKIIKKLEHKSQHTVAINSQITYNRQSKNIELEGQTQVILSKNEVLLLECMLDNKNNIVTVGIIIQQVYADNEEVLDFSPRIKTLISSLKRKIPTLPIENQYGMGYVLKVKT